ncbi:DNA-binding response regulator [Paenibacillus helianthi]|uniref:DNA-binding response regulator n=1 Tax=Paenibacillus helianthi TaxID=1349432 RepID=A0ABX3EVR3_9BACL|nr:MULTISPECIES: response regulator transcription factor [Paenibacillus]OKP65808.1 DNA-binding response regulator [Paenibacillus sp. P3E]OKP90468.1 DNA-binding response regulator [Paenibacillus helianthi]
MSTIKVLIVDDHQLVRDGLKLIVETNERFDIIGEAENGQVALRLIDELKPDVILLDLNMPVMSGMETMEVLSDNQCEIPVIILTTYNEDELMVNALALGAKGYLLKDTNRVHLFRTIESAIRGETLLQSDIMTKVLAAKERKEGSDKKTEIPVLTDKEKIILQFVARGYKSKEIAFDMGVTERTVKAHLTSIYSKLGVDSRSQAVATAMERRIIHI